FRSIFCSITLPPPAPPLFPYTTLFRSRTAELDPSTSPDAYSEPPVDRMAVHAVWEIGLLILGGGILFALTQASSGPFNEGSWNGDRKSTRLNSSHVKISYAVFCLKKKK